MLHKSTLKDIKWTTTVWLMPPIIWQLIVMYFFKKVQSGIVSEPNNTD